MEEWKRYIEVLRAIKNYLEEYGVPYWPETIGKWLEELPLPNDKLMHVHAARTHKMIGGMGSLGDIYISRNAGHRIVGDKAEVLKVNKQLEAMIHELYVVTGALQGNLQGT